MRRLSWLPAILLLWSCGKVLGVRQIPEIAVGEATFFRTIEAHTDAPVTGGNRIDVLLNGDETFPVMLYEIRKAKSTITFAQYLYQDGSIAREFAHAFAERCRAAGMVDSVGKPIHIETLHACLARWMGKDAEGRRLAA